MKEKVKKKGQQSHSRVKNGKKTKEKNKQLNNFVETIFGPKQGFLDPPGLAFSWEK